MRGRTTFASLVFEGMLFPVLLGGLPHRFAVLLWTICGVLFRSTWRWECLVVGGVIHLGFRQATKHDHAFFAIFLAYWRTKRLYTVG